MEEDDSVVRQMKVGAFICPVDVKGGQKVLQKNVLREKDGQDV
jgi:hypothetical protein